MMTHGAEQKGKHFKKNKKIVERKINESWVIKLFPSEIKNFSVCLHGTTMFKEIDQIQLWHLLALHKKCTFK